MLLYRSVGLEECGAIEEHALHIKGVRLSKGKKYSLLPPFFHRITFRTWTKRRPLRAPTARGLRNHPPRPSRAPHPKEKDSMAKHPVSRDRSNMTLLLCSFYNMGTRRARVNKGSPYELLIVDRNTRGKRRGVRRYSHNNMHLSMLAA